ncbi:MAG TPA: hypothetical protein VE713_07945 [Pyrinomonadaceae bacterium]|jgi:hypothetical protein|nr:hypothetical protein [Pyrinomonadaceae bacterium]
MVEEAQEPLGEMRKRRTTLEDGRYLIYYTFGDGPGAARASDGSGPSESREAESKPEPAAPRAVAEEERSV